MVEGAGHQQPDPLRADVEFEVEQRKAVVPAAVPRRNLTVLEELGEKTWSTVRARVAALEVQSAAAALAAAKGSVKLLSAHIAADDPAEDLLQVEVAGCRLLAEALLDDGRGQAVDMPQRPVSRQVQAGSTGPGSPAGEIGLRK